MKHASELARRSRRRSAGQWRVHRKGTPGGSGFERQGWRERWRRGGRRRGRDYRLSGREGLSFRLLRLLRTRRRGFGGFRSLEHARELARTLSRFRRRRILQGWRRRNRGCGRYRKTWIVLRFRGFLEHQRELAGTTRGCLWRGRRRRLWRRWRGWLWRRRRSGRRRDFPRAGTRELRCVSCTPLLFFQPLTQGQKRGRFGNDKGSSVIFANLQKLTQRFRGQTAQASKQRIVVGSFASGKQVYRDFAASRDLTRAVTLSALSRKRIGQLIFLIEIHCGGTASHMVA